MLCVFLKQWRGGYVAAFPPNRLHPLSTFYSHSGRMGNERCGRKQLEARRKEILAWKGLSKKRSSSISCYFPVCLLFRRLFRSSYTCSCSEMLWDSFLTILSTEVNSCDWHWFETGEVAILEDYPPRFQKNLDDIHWWYSLFYYTYIYRNGKMEAHLKSRALILFLFANCGYFIEVKNSGFYFLLLRGKKAQKEMKESSNEKNQTKRFFPPILSILLFCFCISPGLFTRVTSLYLFPHFRPPVSRILAAPVFQ